jgi:outer membrane receptor for ferrienterochelin and colicins
MHFKSKPSRSLCLRLLPAAPAIFGMIAAQAAGQQQQFAPASAEKPAPPIQKVEVKGAAASYDARRNDTATKIVVTQEEILRNGDTTIGDVLKRLPGVTVGGVQGRGGDIRMRGLGSGYTQILLNGEPSPAGFSLDSLAPDMIERIEIMRAATAEYSTQAIAGAINIVLKRAIVTAQREIKAGLQEENGHYGTSARAARNEVLSSGGSTRV